MTHLAAVQFPSELNTQIVSGLEGAFTNGLTFVAPILVAMIGINFIRRMINRGKTGRV